MANYDFRYKLSTAPEAATDGSGMVKHQIIAEATPQGESNWVTVPGRNKTLQVPAAEVTSALVSGTNPQKTAAYKQALKDNVNTIGQAINGWSTAELESLMDANDAASAGATAADSFITVDLGLSYPVTFTV